MAQPVITHTLALLVSVKEMTANPKKDHGAILKCSALCAFIPSSM